jgi:hypothetical protein
MAFFVDYFRFPGASNLVAQTPPKVSYFDCRPTDVSRAIVKGHHESTLFFELRGYGPFDVRTRDNSANFSRYITPLTAQRRARGYAMRNVARREVRRFDFQKE